MEERAKKRGKSCSGWGWNTKEMGVTEAKKVKGRVATI